MHWFVTKINNFKKRYLPVKNGFLVHYKWIILLIIISEYQVSMLIHVDKVTWKQELRCHVLLCKTVFKLNHNYVSLIRLFQTFYWNKVQKVSVLEIFLQKSESWTLCLRDLISVRIVDALSTIFKVFVFSIFKRLGIIICYHLTMVF